MRVKGANVGYSAFIWVSRVDKQKRRAEKDNRVNNAQKFSALKE